MNGTGGIPATIDYRDRQSHAAFTPDEIKSEHFVPTVSVKNQSSVDSCVSHTFCAIAEQRAMVNGIDISLSEKFHYGASLTAAGTLADNGGMRLRRGLDTFRKKGVCLESESPYYPPYNVTPTLAQYEAALDNRIDDYQWLVKSGSPVSEFEKIHLIKSHLQEGFLVAINVALNSGFRSLSGDWEKMAYQKINRLWRPTDFVHCMYLDGFKDRTFRAVNHWGEEWGDSGRCGLPVWIVNEPSFEAVIIRDFNGMLIPESPGIKVEIKDRYNLDVRIVPEPQFKGKKVNLYVVALDEGKILAMTQSGVVNTGKTVVEILDLPAYKTVVLDGSKYVEILDRVDLLPYSGATLYIGYGNGLHNLVSQKVTL